MARVPGRLPLGADLEKALQLCDAVRRCRVVPRTELPRGSGIKGARLLVESVDYVEADVGRAIPDELLALIAVNHPIACLVTGIVGLEAILDATEEAEVDGWLAVGMVYSEPIAEAVQGAHGGPYRTLYVKPGDPTVPTPLRVMRDGLLEEDTTLGEFIRDVIRHDLDQLDDPPRLGDLGIYRAPRPRLYAGRSVAAPAHGGRRVRHKKFGDGTVVGADGDKLTVAFDTAGTKILKASFVTDL